MLPTTTTSLAMRDWPAALLDARYNFVVSLALVPGTFRVPPNWRARLRDSSQHLLHFATEGAFDGRIGDAQMRVQSGDLLWAPPFADLTYLLREGEKLTLLRFRLDARDESERVLTFDAPFLHLSPARDCRLWMERIVDEASFPAPCGAQVTRALLACLCAEIARAHNQQSAVRGQLTPAQRARLEAYAGERVASWPTPRDLAEAVELSPDYFARCFRATYGQSPRRWLLEQRVRLGALRLLESNLNVSQVARELGYDDVFLFSRQFKAVMGHSPRAYRQDAEARS